MLEIPTLAVYRAPSDQVVSTDSMGTLCNSRVAQAYKG